MAFKNKYSISRQKIEFYYSIAILVVIPVLIVVNTLLITQAAQDSFERELRRKASLASRIMGETIKTQIDDQNSVQIFLENIINLDDEVVAVSVVVPTESPNVFRVVADSDLAVVDTDINEGIYAIAAVQDREENGLSRGIAQIFEDENGERVWSIVQPIYVDDQIVAFTKINVSSNSSDMLVSQLFSRSLFIMIAVVTVVTLLLLNHFKFVQYAVLFKKLEEVDQLKNDFLSVATHELKAPMAVIKGSLENILDGVVGHVDDDAKEALQIALTDTDRLANLVSDLLNVSRIEQGRISYNLEAVDVSEVIMRVVQAYKQKAADKGLTITYEQPEQDYLISVDRGRFIEIMTNLIDNAVKYSKKGSVVIRHDIADDKIKTMVKDTGVGMSGKERERLFSRFYRIRNEATKDIRGTGLGLWIIKQYIEAMDGHIYVDSLEGVGSEFTVEFPLTAEKPAEAKKETDK